MTFNRQEFNFYKALIVQYTTFNIGSENMINVKHYPDSPEFLALFSLTPPHASPEPHTLP